MAQWGHTSGTESKPNWLSDAEKTNTSSKTTRMGISNSSRF